MVNRLDRPVSGIVVFARNNKAGDCLLQKWNSKEVIKKMAVELVETNKLAQPDDIYFLNWYELIQIWDAKAGDYARLASERRVAFPRYQKMTPPWSLPVMGKHPL